ncbi:MAG TPA: glycosyltransferase family 2 protein [Blastocatellia bacterium]
MSDLTFTKVEKSSAGERITLTILVWVFWIISIVWLVALAYNVFSIRSAPRLPRNVSATKSAHATARNSPAGKGIAPLVSILVPARNEAARVLAQSVGSMLAQDYPNFEVIAVDDRSTDNTLALLEDIARSDPRLTVVRGRPLPDGWIGKPWALEQARRKSRGQWLLATDADIIFHPTVLSRAMAVAEAEAYDALTLAPGISTDSFWAKLVMPVAGWMIMLVYPAWRVNNPDSEIALGVGGFFLMRRAAHEQVGGYEAIRADVTDDLNTARLLKRAGFRLHLAAAPTLLRTPMYASLKELFEGFGKNAFVGSGSSAPRAVLSGVLDLAFTVAPPVTVVVALAIVLVEGSRNLLPLAAAALAAYLSLVAAFAPVYKETRTPINFALLGFLAHAVMVMILFHSTWRVMTGRGVVWKSRSLYRTAGRDSTSDTRD